LVEEIEAFIELLEQCGCDIPIVVSRENFKCGEKDAWGGIGRESGSEFSALITEKKGSRTSAVYSK